MNTEPQVTLAIEAAIAGGSLSLIRDGEELGNWIGRSDVSKAEELLIDIDAMLTACGVSKHDIDLVAVSAGPGSFTGIRIGIATALGIKAGLGTPITSVSAMEAICRSALNLRVGDTQARGLTPTVTVAVPVGRNAVCIQTFENSEKAVSAIDSPRSVPETDLENITAEQIMLHAALFEKYSALPNAVDFGANIAYAVGKLATAAPGSLTEPLFVSKNF